MKALSIKQPFAELILQGRKTIELRNWITHFRGSFLIHASQTVDANAMRRFGFSTLPTGCIVGHATLVDVKTYANEHEHQRDKNKHLASSSWGAHGFILEHPVRRAPIPTKGRLGFWEYANTSSTAESFK